MSARRPFPLFYQGVQIERGVLLIHGFTGSTRELDPLARYLHQQGLTVHAPLLKGHGTTPEEMSRTTWVDWWASALKGYQLLKEKGCRQLVVIGFSMGGLLALKLAQYQQVNGIVSLCTPLVVRDPRLGLARYVSGVWPYVKRRRRKPAHIERHLYLYEQTPVACVASLQALMENVRLMLPVIKAPILVIQAERDETVHPLSAQLLYQQVASQDKTLRFFSRSGHMITLDHDRDAVQEEIARFIRRVIDA